MATRRRTGRKKNGLGVSIPVLTGKVARSILLERIEKDFLSGENSCLALEEKKNNMLSLLDTEGNGRPRSPLTYKTATEFANAYRESIKRKRRNREKLEKKIASMPFRGNPFR